MSLGHTKKIDGYLEIEFNYQKGQIESENEIGLHNRWGDGIKISFEELDKVYHFLKPLYDSDKERFITLRVNRTNAIPPK